MKFDYCIGNPPYQGDNHMQLYPSFYLAGKQIADCVDMIFPTGWQEPKTAKNLKLMNTADVKEDKQIVLIDNKQNVFNGVTGAEWTNIILWKRGYDNGLDGEQLVLTNGENPQTVKLRLKAEESKYAEVKSVIAKVVSDNNNFESIVSIIHLQSKLNLDVLYNDYPDAKDSIGSKGTERRIVTNSFVALPIFHNKQDESDVAILGITNHNRMTKYVDAKYIDDSNIFNHKVILAAAGYGVIGDECVPIISEPFYGEVGMGFSQSFMSFGSFDNKEEAIACEHYIRCKFFRFMVGTLKISQHNHNDVFAYVPLQDFTSNSDIDWNQSIVDIDKQLYRKYGLSQDEIDFIETHVKEMN